MGGAALLSTASCALNSVDACTRKASSFRCALSVRTMCCAETRCSSEKMGASDFMCGSSKRCHLFTSLSVELSFRAVARCWHLHASYVTSCVNLSVRRCFQRFLSKLMEVKFYSAELTKSLCLTTDLLLLGESSYLAADSQVSPTGMQLFPAPCLARKTKRRAAAPESRRLLPGK